MIVSNVVWSPPATRTPACVCATFVLPQRSSYIVHEYEQLNHSFWIIATHLQQGNIEKRSSPTPGMQKRRPPDGSDQLFGAILWCETKHTMQLLGVCRYGNNQQTCQHSKIHDSSRTAKSVFSPAGPRWDFSVTRGVSRAQNKL